MGRDDVMDLDAVGMAELVQDGECSASELTEWTLERIDRVDGQLGAFVHVAPEAARARSAGPLEGPLAGVPFAVKDAIGYPGMRWAMGARLFADNPTPAHSDYTQALEDAGLVTVGKTATSELALLGSTETLLEGVTANPWREGVSAGGSSGGAAAAVAAGLVPVAHASDGGGSVRGPASMCGLFGFKPTNGRTLPGMPGEEGLAALVVEHVISRSVRDSAMMLAVTERPRPGGGPPVGFVRPAPLPSLRVGTWSTTLMGHEPDPVVAEGLASTAKLVEQLGHRVEPLPPPAIDGQATSDAFFTLAGQAVDQVAAMVAPMLGRDVGSDELEPFTLELLEWYRGLPPDAGPGAAGALQQAATAYLEVFEEVDVVLTPTLSTPPWAIGHLSPTLPRAELVARTERAVGYTPIHNMAGCPAMSVPLEWSPDGLPLGMHVAGPPGADQRLLELAHQLESARPWAHRRPALAGG